MQEWWNALASQEQVLWGLLIASGTVFVIQSLLTLFGLGDDVDADADADVDADADSDGFMGYFSFRNMVAFFLGFSSGTLALLEQKLSIGLASVLGIGVGVVFVTVVMLLMGAMSKLKSDGTISLKQSVGKEGTVSISIGESAGKVALSLQGRLTDLEAISDSSEIIRPGERVKVLDVQGNKLLVRKIS